MKEIEVVASNKKASFEFNFISHYKAGMMLTGTEVKSIRSGKISLAESFCVMINGDLWVKNMHIAEYKEGSYNNHEPKRMRKLLLNRHELSKIESKLKEKGVTVVPVQLFFNERGIAKLEIALARGKKLFDKRDALKEKDLKRQMARNDQ